MKKHEKYLSDSKRTTFRYIFQFYAKLQKGIFITGYPIMWFKFSKNAILVENNWKKFSSLIRWRAKLLAGILNRRFDWQRYFLSINQKTLSWKVPNYCWSASDFLKRGVFKKFVLRKISSLPQKSVSCTSGIFAS